jgi:hypothetical protein
MDLFPMPQPPTQRGTLLNARNAHEIAARKGVPLQTLEFVAALNACSQGGSLPHPILGRNGGLVVSCRRWLSAGIVPGGHEALGLLTGPESRFFANEELLTGAVEHDPLWQQGRLALPAGVGRDRFSAEFGVPPLMFWTRPNAVIECTDALEQMLVASDLGDDLAAGILHPPAPACYIGFGESFQEAVAPEGRWPGLDYCVPEGAYVFETATGTGRMLAIVLIFGLPGRSSRAIRSFEVAIDDEAQPINIGLLPAVGQANPEVAGPHVVLMQTVAKVFLYMGMPQAVQRDERSYSNALNKLIRLGPKKAAKMQRQLMDLYDRILVGPDEIPGHGPGEVSPHLRRGHFRMQPHGPQNSLRKLVFIAPTWVRADRLQV